jgi:hypothetical protein
MASGKKTKRLRGVGNKRLIAILLVALAATGACTSDDPGDVSLATQCMRASDDNRAKLSSSWLSSAEIEVRGDLITVRTEVPVGISIGGRVTLRKWVYRCRRQGERIEFLGYEAE